MESCFGAVKMELEMEYYENERDAREEIGGYLRYYNTRRRHSALGYLTPEEFEDARCSAARTSQRDPERQESTANRAQQNGRIKRYPKRG